MSVSTCALSPEQMKYLKLLREKYPTVQSLYAQISLSLIHI